MKTGSAELQQHTIAVNTNSNWSLSTNIRHTVIYPAVLILISFAINYFFIAPVLSNLPAANIIYAGAFLLLGLIHIFIFPKWLAHLWEPGFMYGTLYTIALAAILCIAPPILFSMRAHQLQVIVPVASSAFLLPYAVYASVHYFRGIGAKQYQAWFIPPDVEPDTRKSLLLNSIPFKIKINIKQRDMEATEFVINLHPKLKLSTVFIRFLYDRHDIIEMTNSNGDTYGWLFSIKKRIGKKMLDPDLSLMENGVKEDDVIIAERLLGYE